MSKKKNIVRIFLNHLVNRKNRYRISRANTLCINTKYPELVIRRLIPSYGKPKVLYWIFGNINKAQSKLFRLTEAGILPTSLGLKYGAQFTCLGFRIDITKPDLHELCRDLKIRRIRIVSTYLPDI